MENLLSGKTFLFLALLLVTAAYVGLRFEYYHEVVENNNLPIDKFLLNRGTFMGNNASEKSHLVFPYVEISSRRLQKKTPDEVIWITCFGKEETYFRFTKEKPSRSN